MAAKAYSLGHVGRLDMVAAYAGATISESMARLGHSSPKMALHYAERAADRDAFLAERISALATAPKTE